MLYTVKTYQRPLSYPLPARFPSQSGTLPTSRPAPPSSDEEEESESDDESYEEPSMPARQYSPPIAQQPSSYPMPNQNYNNVPPYGMMSAFPQAHEQRIEPLEKKQKVARDPLDKGKEKEKKPKKPKAKPEYVCQNCGRNDSPEWRKVSLRNIYATTWGHMLIDGLSSSIRDRLVQKPCATPVVSDGQRRMGSYLRNEARRKGIKTIKNRLVGWARTISWAKERYRHLINGSERQL